MGQEFFINSQELEDKIRKLLPSQGGAGAGFDLSASTQIIPIIDVTESAEGSGVRPDLQSALSFGSVTQTQTENATSTIISNTGYYRIFGTVYGDGAGSASINATDGVTTKVLLKYYFSTTLKTIKQYDFIVFLPAGISINQISTSGVVRIETATRQLADIDGNLVNP
tara:strand:+ start:139 stop:642 length:504 start_codon:yes stop_codon:yes gene_type:complete